MDSSTLLNTWDAVHSTKMFENFGQNWMDRSGPTQKLSKKRVHLITFLDPTHAFPPPPHSCLTPTEQEG